MINKRLVSTGQLVDELGGAISRWTISRYVRLGLLKPATITPGGQFRWDVEDTRRQLDELRERDE